MKNAIINSPKLTFLSAAKERIEKNFPVLFEKYILPRLVKKHDNRLQPVIKKFIEQAMSQNPIPLFTKVEIETINRCNNTCNFCPVNKNIDKRPLKIMDMDIFNSIIRQLKDLNYSGSIGLFSNNEPLMDNRIADLCAITKKELPAAYLYLYTNGLLLTTDKLDALMKSLDKLFIDNYDDNRRLIEPVRKIYDYCIGKGLYHGRIEIIMRKQNEHLSTRAGQASNRSKIEPLRSSCIYPFCQLVIRPDGKVSLCCNDALGNMTMGDISTEKIVNIWHNGKYRDIRNILLKGRQGIDLCRSCDFIGIPGSIAG